MKIGYNIKYKYDDGGIRTQKTINGVITDFVTNGVQVLAQKTGDDKIIWQIDGNGETVGFNYNGTEYFYLKNAQSDIVGITDITGSILVEYVYDSWGKLVSITGGSGENVTDNTSHIGYINPLRYRSYYYDTETELYYLNARYYDPETGRFINSDDNFEGGLNLFAYCYNNPVMFFDPSGDIAIVDDVVVVTLVGGAALTMATANYYQWLASAEGQKAMNDGAKANAAKWVGDKTKEALDNVLMFAKGGKQNIKDTGLSGLSDSELESKYKDPNTSKLDKQKIKKEQKARKTRHSGQKK